MIVGYTVALQHGLGFTALGLLLSGMVAFALAAGCAGIQVT
jgi:hypothetical protein